ncbi:dihydrolipoamide acetyltransferase family protein [Microbacterium sp. ARD32]|uniref:dihydrolipoamide acetyltransferase family protein n=1 Tax=Microbacterium sp. ARD32 TaxID=2962577 RepID=UPI002881B39D|nr:dihydrolipoamide acetyltransferase family protein [Microbacterium sp. ARD32]MDT0156545.1 dihydrolipoamide acetyltransferase family protein [Microbacterium sp. ARD32]
MSTATARVFRLPDLGEGLTEAGLVQWLVQVGDSITTDQPIAEVETAKSIVELPSPFAGVIVALHGAPGDVIEVGAPVLEVTDSSAGSGHEGQWVAEPVEASTDATEQEAYRSEERAGSGNVLIGYGTTERPTGRRRPRTLASPAAASSAPDAEQSARRTVAVRSPIVRRLARDLGVNVRELTGTGTDGAVTRADVLRAAVDAGVDAGVDAATASRASTHSRTPRGPGTTAAPGDAIDGLAVRSRERMSPLRKTVSAALSRSRSEIPEATVWVDVDATELWNLRAQLAPEGGRAPSLTALLARFVLIALEQHPLLAARLGDDAAEIITFEGVNLGIAADTERGLMVPVLPRAHELSIEQLDAALRELAETARSGRMPPERLRGSTFTLNNYGGLGVDGSAPIINHPDVAMLGIGRIIERAWVVDGAIAVRRIAQLSLVFDHRVCDGGYAAAFLRRVVDLIEHPLRAYGRVR